jgi:hypothetical protein
MANILFNTDMIESHERRIQVEKLTPIGREILENYKPIRVDERTIKFVKPKHFKSSFSGKVIKNSGGVIQNCG